MPKAFSSPYRLIILSSLFVTVALGITLRWIMANVISLPIDFAFARHAHSHLGIFGILFPLAWIAWYRADIRVPGNRFLLTYAALNILAFFGFLRNGYAGAAIAASTGISLLWILSAIPTIRLSTQWRSPKGGFFWAIILSLACIPFVAYFARRQPSLSASFVSTFLTAILFLVIIPSALLIRRNLVLPWPLLLVTGASSALAFGVADFPITRIGTILYAATIVYSALSTSAAETSFPNDLKITWTLVAAGIASIALGIIPNNRSVAVASIHFVILGPLLATLFLPTTSPQPHSQRRWFWWGSHFFAAGMSFALMLQAFGAPPSSLTAAALFGTAWGTWWGASAIWHLLQSRSTSKTTSTPSPPPTHGQ